MFTDIEGSTKLWERFPEQMRAALTRHDELAEKIVSENGGEVVRARGEGDSLFCVFSTASGAVRAACSLQLAFASEPWPDGLEIVVRMAAHTGTADARDGDYYGSDVNRTARLRSLAHGGQVVVSHVTHELAGGGELGGVSFLDLGEYRLRDLSKPERVFQVLHPRLPSEFPPLKALSVSKSNLPIQVTSFIGREADITETRSLLASTRLLTLTGSGGVGKTRLAIYLGADVSGEFEDGVCFVELAAIAQDQLVGNALLSALGIREEAGRTALQTLVEHLQTKKQLLILDNCEHLLASCAEICSTLLRTCDGVKIVTTSREPLAVAGEITYRVASLQVPSIEDGVSADDVLATAAGELFVERARAAQQSFQVTDENAEAIGSICARLDGIPLAIELAAARVKSMKVEQIAERLHDRFRLLTGGDRTALPRQQTLRALIDWSYSSLSEEEKVLLRRLSVFAGGWTLQAAEEVCSGRS